LKNQCPPPAPTAALLMLTNFQYASKQKQTANDQRLSLAASAQKHQKGFLCTA
jgi:hypothetical protein